MKSYVLCFSFCINLLGFCFCADNIRITTHELYAGSIRSLVSNARRCVEKHDLEGAQFFCDAIGRQVVAIDLIENDKEKALLLRIVSDETRTIRDQKISDYVLFLDEYKYCLLSDFPLLMVPPEPPSNHSFFKGRPSFENEIVRTLGSFIEAAESRLQPKAGSK